MRMRVILIPLAVAALLCIRVGAGAQEHPLSRAQIQTLKAVRVRSEKSAAPLARKLTQTARKVYENMLSDHEDQRLRGKLERELQKIGSALISIKGQSIREMVAVLTPEQKQLLKAEMRKPGASADLSEVIGRVFNIPEK